MDIALSFCCMSPYELGVSRALCLAFSAVLLGPVPAALYDALWTLPALSKEARKEAYYELFGLQRELIFNPVTEEFEEWVFIVDLPFWLEMIEYAASSEGTCPEGCKRPIFSKS